MSWLKEAANQNMEDMSVTDETSHRDMSPSKSFALRNM